MENMYILQFDKMDKKLSIEENFIEALKQERNADREYFKGLNIFYHLFFMLHFYNKNFMRQVVEEYREIPDGWFYNFHKQFRQLDMFDGAGFFDRRISEENNERRNELFRLRDQRIKEARPSHKDYDNEDVWYKVLNNFYATDEVLKELKTKIRALNTHYNSYEMKESFGGNMDMVMWLTISNDRHNSLYRFMDEFLAMYHNVLSYEEKSLSKEDNGDR